MPVTGIVSLSPAATGILVDLGLADDLIGVDQHSYVLYDLEDVYVFDFMNVSTESLLMMAPGLVIGHDMMVGGPTDSPLAPLTETGTTVIYLMTATSLAEISEQIEKLAEATDREDVGATLKTEFLDQLTKISEVASARGASPTVYFEISPAPDMFTSGSDTFQQALLELVGAVNVFANESGWLSVGDESVVVANPDVIFTNASFLEDPIAEILSRPGWSQISAVRDGRIYYIDNDRSGIPNHRVTEALWMMLEALADE